MIVVISDSIDDGSAGRELALEFVNKKEKKGIPVSSWNFSKIKDSFIYTFENNDRLIVTSDYVLNYSDKYDYMITYHGCGAWLVEDKNNKVIGFFEFRKD